jgi:glycosyltransferase, group 2 family
MKTITCIIPCKNEEENLPKLYEALNEFSASINSLSIESFGQNLEQTIKMSNYNWQFLFIDDGSTDKTRKILKDLRATDTRVSFICLSRNFGKENALLAGMDYASGDAVIIMDADLQHPLSAIPEMIYWWEKGYKDVYGKRVIRGKESHIRKFFSISYYKVLSHMTNIDVLPNVGDFRLLDRVAVKALCTLRETQRYTKGLYCWIGFNKKDVPFVTMNRTAGKSNFGMIKLFNLAIEGITSYTTTPLRISTFIGIIISLLAFAYLIFILFKTLIWGESVSGFPTLICVILFLGGIQLLALGIIGEYIGRIFNETKGRPPYIIDSYNDELTH